MFPQLQFSVYHKILRVGLCVLTCVLVFDSGLFTVTTARLSNNTQLYLANAVSISVGVPENELNTLTAEIATLTAERDLAIGLSTASTDNDWSTFILSAMVFILLVLILLNYVLDFVRARALAARNEKNTPSLA